tara:strand:- start:379 stop:2244 length:1866 start_codon:yes stop_codon:yes gene_type:complete
MAEATKLRVSELDFDQIKNNFKSFLKEQDTFRDYNLDGSNISILLDILAYNTHYNAFYLNMVANEMFIDSATTRNAMISLSKLLGYVPKSRTSAKANVNISITPNDAPASVTIAKNTKFSTAIEGVNYTFVSDQSYSTSANSDNATVTLQNVSLIEGDPLTFNYTANTKDSSQKFTIPNRGVDHSTITVSIKENSFTTELSPYTKASDLLEVSSTSNVFFIEEGTDFLTEVKFGDGVLGRKLKTGNIVIIDYNVSSGSLGNGANNFAVASTAGGYSTVTLVTNDKAEGGSDEESINSIRFNAPRHYNTQNRAVTTDDYKRIVLRDYPLAESIVVYGGEDADPPEYGKVFIGIKPKSGLHVTDSVKSNIRDNILKKYNVASITPVFVDLDYIYVLLTTTVDFDSRKTTTTSQTLRSNIIKSINTYVSEELYKFEQTFRLSKLQTRIDDTDSSILGDDSAIRLKKIFIPTLNTKMSYTLRFNNAISHPHTGHASTLASTAFSITDEKDILRQDCKIKDLNGILYIYRTNNEGTEIFVRENMGTIDYITGKVILNSFDPASYAGSEIGITSIPVLGDVLSLREQLITIQEADINLKMNDTSISTQKTQVTTSESSTSQTTKVNY